MTHIRMSAHEVARRYGISKNVGTTVLVPGAEIDTSGRFGGRPVTHEHGEDAEKVLAATPFGARANRAASVSAASLLANAFRIRRFESSGEYPFHALFPSVRAKYPILLGNRCGLVFDPWLWAWRGAESGDHGAAGPVDSAGYELRASVDRLPDFYGDLRTILVRLELGMTLRHCAVTAAVFGRELTDVVDDLSPRAPGATFRVGGADDIDPDIAPAAGPGNGTRTWATVLAARSAGRMPRGLPGLYLAPTSGLSGTQCAALRRWTLSPGPITAGCAAGLTLTLIVRTGTEFTVYSRASTEQTWARRVLPASASAALLSGHGGANTPRNGNYLQRAEAVLFVTADLLEIQREGGDRAVFRSCAQAGWIVQGLTYPAAYFDRIARPTRSFDDVTVTTALTLPRAHHVLLACVIGKSPVQGIEVPL
ncbi:hypothetical protein [Nocardia nova]|uniref:hypothetical protein n=1 Tax=Nocardia nova TaxID=37330 RepID=UPI0033FDF507